MAVTSSPDLGAMPQPSNIATAARQMQRRATIGDVPRARPDRLERSDKNWCFLRHAQGEILNIKVSNAAGISIERARTAHTSLAGAVFSKMCLGGPWPGGVTLSASAEFCSSRPGTENPMTRACARARTASEN
jgi:hypothetical protein